MTPEHRVALVTGAGRRVGRAIALRLARGGWSVAVHYHRSADEAGRVVEACRALGVRAEALSADLADSEACRDLVIATQASFGALGCLVNNASIFERRPLDALSVADIDRHLAVNLRAPLLLAQEAADALRESEGLIVNLSDAAVTRPWPDHLAYMISKGGLDTLTAGLARALAPRVRVVGIAPGVAAWPEDYDEAARARLTARIPLGRAGTPEDIAELVAYLLTHGGYISGTTIPVDGGRHVV